MLPKGWVEYRLGEIAEFKNGLNFNKSDGGESIKIVGVSDFKNRSELQNTDELDTVRVANKVRDAELLTSGDLLFVRSNGNKELIGRCLYFPDVRERIAFSGFTIRGRVNRKILNPSFASYLMRSVRVKNQIFLGGSGTNISNLSQEILSSINVLVPPPSEQIRIAEILGTWDQAIHMAEKLKANASLQKQRLMSALLLGRRRRSGNVNSWGSIGFGDTFDRVRRKNSTGNTNVLTISGERGLVSQRDYFNKSIASADLSGYTLLLRGEFAYNKSYSMGYPVGAIKPLLNYDAGVVSSLYLCFRLRDDIDASADFFRHYFEAGMFNQEIQSIAQEGARNHGLLNVSALDLFKLRMHVPAANEQRAIAQVINTAEQEELTFAAQVKALRAEKLALMSQLLTGKRRVSPTSEVA